MRGVLHFSLPTYIITRNTVKGERLKNKSTQDLFRIERIENEKVFILEGEKGLVRIWFPREQLGFFFEKMKGV